MRIYLFLKKLIRLIYNLGRKKDLHHKLSELFREHGVFGALYVMKIRISNYNLTHDLEAKREKKILNLSRSITSGVEIFKDTTLIVGTLSIPQCKKYRVLQRAEALEKNGRSALISDFRDVIRWRSLMQISGELIIYRVPHGADLEKIISEARRLKIKIIYDIDDPIFCKESVISNKNIEHLSGNVKKGLFSDVSAYQKALDMADEITVSTLPLKNCVISCINNKKVTVFRNGVDDESKFYGEVARSNKLKVNDGLTVAVASGSSSHDADFGLIDFVLKELLVSNKEIKLILIGSHPKDVFYRQSSQCKYYEFTSYPEYLKILSEADVVLIPLLDCKFNESKSIVRFMDATLAGATVVASAVGEYKEIAQAGVCLSATSVSEWKEIIVNMAKCKEKYSDFPIRALDYLQNERGSGYIYSEWIRNANSNN